MLYKMDFADRKIFSLFLILGAFVSTECFGQGQVFKVVDDSVSVIVTGESSLLGWTVTTSNVSGYPDELQLTPAEGETIDNFSFKVGVASMDGGRGSAMNTKIFTALESNSFPTITYDQTEPAIIVLIDGSTFSLKSNGTLTVAGASKTVSINIEGTISDGLLKLNVRQELKMSDFGIDPPSAMFGQIQTKDDIAVTIKFVYQLIN